MLNRVRKMVYNAGFRPKPGTILYSSVLNNQRAFEDAIKFFQELDKNDPYESRLVTRDDKAPQRCVVCGCAVGVSR